MKVVVHNLSVTCPVCGIQGFTPQGLRAHRCRAMGRSPLPKAKWKKTVDDARAQRLQDVIDKAAEKEAA